MLSTISNQIGSVTVPLSSVSDGGTLASLCDPAITTLLAAFQSVLRAKLNPAWSKAAKGISSTIVAASYPCEPNRPTSQMTWLWPGLFMWRTSEVLRKRTQHMELAEATGKLALVLPPLPMELLWKLEPIRVAARTVLVSLIRENGDQSYSAGANLLHAAGVESFQFTQAQYGYLPADNLSLMHPTLDMTWVMRERETRVTTYLSSLSSLSTTISVMEEAGYTNYTDVSIFTYDPTDDVPSGDG